MKHERGPVFLYRAPLIVPALIRNIWSGGNAGKKGNEDKFVAERCRGFPAKAERGNPRLPVIPAAKGVAVGYLL